jgi:hypothetical protein
MHTYSAKLEEAEYKILALWLGMRKMFLKAKHSDSSLHPSYARDRNWKNQGLRPVQAKS